MELPGKVLETIATNRKEYTADKNSYLKKQIADSFNKIKSTCGKEVVLVIGDSGSEKNTVINYLLGNKLKQENNERRDKIDVLLGQSSEKNSADRTIDNRKLITPKAYESEDGLVYCELPAMTDVNTKEEKFLVSVNTQIAITQANKVKAVVVVIDFNDFLSEEESNFLKVSLTLKEIIKKHDEMAPSTFFVITNVPTKFNKAIVPTIIFSQISIKPDSHRNYRVTGENELAKIQLLQWMKKNQQNLIILDEKLAEQRMNIVERLKASVTKFDKTFFNFNHYNAERSEFDEVIYSATREAEETFCKKVELEKQKASCQLELKKCKEGWDFYDGIMGFIKENHGIKGIEAQIIEFLQKAINAIAKELSKYVNEIDANNLFGSGVDKLTASLKQLPPDKKDKGIELVALVGADELFKQSLYGQLPSNDVVASQKQIEKDIALYLDVAKKTHVRQHDSLNKKLQTYTSELMGVNQHLENNAEFYEVARAMTAIIPFDSNFVNAPASEYGRFLPSQDQMSTGSAKQNENNSDAFFEKKFSPKKSDQPTSDQPSENPYAENCPIDSSIRP